MKYNYINYLIFLFAIIVIGCSSTQSTEYNPGDGQNGWKVNVTKKAGFTDEFICTINDSTVISASFSLLGDNFEKSGTYRGKKVTMNGYKSSASTTDSNGKITSTDKYQIRVFIDSKLIDKFDF